MFQVGRLPAAIGAWLVFGDVLTFGEGDGGISYLTSRLTMAMIVKVLE